MDLPSYLQLYDEAYFTGHRSVSGYADYAHCRDVLERWVGMVEALARPSSVLDVGCAYGFVIEAFRRLGVPAFGIEPSAFARAQVRRSIAEYVVAGALPALPDLAPHFAARDSEPGRFDVVLCTEVLEHLPPELVRESVCALAEKADRLLICLVMLDGHPTAHDDAGHLCLQYPEWWHLQFDHTGLTRRKDLERLLNEDPFSLRMGWHGRFFVRERVV